MEPSMYHFQATTMSEDLLCQDPLQRGYPVALIVCQSCVEVRNYSLRVIFKDFLLANKRESS